MKRHCAVEGFIDSAILGLDIAAEGGHGAGSQSYARGSGEVDVVDAINGGIAARHGDGQRRVAQESVFEFVDVDIGVVRHDITLGQTQCLAHGVGLGLVHQMFEQRQIERFVVVSINRAGGTDHSHGSTLVVHQSASGYVVAFGVVGRNFARGHHPKRQATSRRQVEVVFHQNFGV